MKIICKQDGVIAFVGEVKYTFNKAGEPIEVEEEHAKMLLANPLFEKVEETEAKETRKKR